MYLVLIPGITIHYKSGIYQIFTRNIFNKVSKYQHHVDALKNSRWHVCTIVVAQNNGA